MPTVNNWVHISVGNLQCALKGAQLSSSVLMKQRFMSYKTVVVCQIPNFTPHTLKSFQPKSCFLVFLSLRIHKFVSFFKFFIVDNYAQHVCKTNVHSDCFPQLGLRPPPPGHDLPFAAGRVIWIFPPLTRDITSLWGFVAVVVCSLSRHYFRKLENLGNSGPLPLQQLASGGAVSDRRQRKVPSVVILSILLNITKHL